ncbi:hypothetical protein CGRA01v4_07225 [Colletotrichum graminicola]|nr:hypothetical protein CGRA01v4_07225 [Colletotrichum graminicola]
MISVGITTLQPSSTILFKPDANASLRSPNTMVASGAIVMNNGAHNCRVHGTCQLQTQHIHLVFASEVMVTTRFIGSVWQVPSGSGEASRQRQRLHP